MDHAVLVKQKLIMVIGNIMDIFKFFKTYFGTDPMPFQRRIMNMYIENKKRTIYPLYARKAGRKTMEKFFDEYEKNEVVKQEKPLRDK